MILETSEILENFSAFLGIIMIQSCLRSSNDPKMMWLTSFGGCRTGTKIIIINYFSLFWLHQKRWLFGSAIRNGFRKWNDSSFPKFPKRSKWSPTIKSCLKICIFLVNKSVLIIMCFFVIFYSYRKQFQQKYFTEISYKRSNEKNIH